MTATTPHPFTTADDAILVFLNSPDIVARAAAFEYLQQRLPPDARAEMQRRAEQLVGLDRLTPRAWNASGEPLYAAEDIARMHGLPLDQVVSEGQRLKDHLGGDCTPVEQLTLTPITGSLRQGQFQKTEQVDADGDPIYNLDGRAVLQLLAEWIKEGGDATAQQLFNRYCALAAQRGCSSQVIDHLRKAARKGNGPDFLRWLDRAARHCPEDDWLLSEGFVAPPAA